MKVRPILLLLLLSITLPARAHFLSSYFSYFSGIPSRITGWASGFWFVTNSCIDRVCQPLQTQISGLVDQLQQEDTNLFLVNSDLGSLRRAQSQNNEHFETFRKDLALGQAQIEKSIKERVEAQHALQSNITEVQSDITPVQQKTHALQGAIAQVNRNLITHEAYAATSLRKIADDQTAHTAELNQRVDTFFGPLNTQLAALASMLQTNSSMLKELHGQIDTAAQQFAQLDQHEQQINQKITDVKNDLRPLGSRIHELAELVTSFEKNRTVKNPDTKAFTLDGRRLPLIRPEEKTVWDQRK